MRFISDNEEFLTYQSKLYRQQILHKVNGNNAVNIPAINPQLSFFSGTARKRMMSEFFDDMKFIIS